MNQPHHQQHAPPNQAYAGGGGGKPRRRTTATMGELPVTVQYAVQVSTSSGLDHVVSIALSNVVFSLFFPSESPSHRANQWTVG